MTIPSVIAAQLRRGVEDYLRATFPITTPHFEGLVDRLLIEDRACFKGPYVSIGLPFRPAYTGMSPLERVPLPFPAHTHQQRAFERLTGPEPLGTLIATGTGSGKTECFLYPILEYCARHRGEPGVKAILIYPMNALATDQAARLAAVVHGNANLRGYVSAGLFIGDEGHHPSDAMTAETIITDRERLRSHPPDILLTNYKMLDYLLMRPVDQGLWARNEPRTLRFLVVDELHTFDGAQGTDLACLLRRLKARLASPGGWVCGIGTSATLGGEDDPQGLAAFAGHVFGEAFDASAVIREDRLTPGEYLADYLVETTTIPTDATPEAMDAGSYAVASAYLSAQARLWLPRFNGDVSTDADRFALAEHLLQHVAVHNLVKRLGRGPVAFEALAEWAVPLFGARDPPHAGALLVGLLALLSAARRPAPGATRGDGRSTSLVDLRLQLWLREWRRMVASVDGVPRLRFHDDLTDDEKRAHLPVVNCRHCGATGWLAVWRDGDPRVTSELTPIYQAFFGNDPTARVMFPDAEPGDGARSLNRYLGRDLRLERERSDSDAVRVWIPAPRRTSDGHIRLDRDCPYCGANHGLAIVGAQSASLSAVLVSQWAATGFAADKRLIAFSDSVQDAAHRAGFLTARTWRPHFRTALLNCLDSLPTQPTLAGLTDLFLNYWREQLGGEERLVGEFLPSDLQWRRDYEQLRTTGSLPDGSSLPVWLSERIAWECASEFGLRARIGRTLETTGLACASGVPERVREAAERTLAHLLENLPDCTDLSIDELIGFLGGWLHHLRHRGGILIPQLKGLIDWGGKTIWFVKGGAKALPNLGGTAAAPRFVTFNAPGVFDVLPPRGNGWHVEWLRKTLANERALLSARADVVYQYAVTELERAGLLAVHAHSGQPVWGLSPEAVRIEREVGHLRCAACQDRVAVPEPTMTTWDGLACLRAGCRGAYAPEPGRTQSDYYARLYRQGGLHRVNARDHTGLLKRSVRESLEEEFKSDEGAPWRVNLLSATPTLEMGIDIGALSAVLLCSVPPAQAGYVQRVGRAGRRDGNALAMTVAEGRAHDLYFYTEPLEMIAGPVEPPGVFLDASAVLQRQFTAYCLDRWTASGITQAQFPGALRRVLDRVEVERRNGFPYDWLDFAEGRRTALLDEFFRIFPELSDGARDHIRVFAEGSGGTEGSLAWRLLDALTRLALQRKSLVAQIKALAKRIHEGDADPARGEAWQEERRELEQEWEGYRAIVKSINEQHALNFFTDEGVIPNYAFPESGITLRSVIIRHRGRAESEDGRRYDILTFDYVRPAAAALSELAPNATFYAEGRRVRIDRVDVDVSEVEPWRLCPDCQYAERELGAHTHTTCPRCGAAGFQDNGQSRPMIRLKQVYATTNERQARFGDDSDQRDETRYERGRAIDVAPEHVDQAWVIDDPEFPFGFEFASHAVLREVNYGEQGQGAPMLVAGHTKPRAGFRLCRYCGTIQAARPNAKQKHTRICRAADSDDDAQILSACFLYRELASEAIRVLLPATTAAADERVPHSFIAALLFGLRRRFGGRVDHLHTTLMEEPVPGIGASRQYVVLYDSIPGGSGYLPELLRTAQPFLDLLTEALTGLEQCTCAADPARDGCYRCVYVYRLRDKLDQTSRRTAVEILKRALANRNRLKLVDRLQSVSLNALFESELEARFVEALRRADHEGRPVRLAAEVVSGKAGYILTAGGCRYTVEPQADLGQADGVAVPSRADFLIRPTRTAADRLPVAVYTDGLEYHRKIVREDIVKRLAVCRSARYLAWGLGWKDVDQGLDPNAPAYYEDVFRVPAARAELLNRANASFGATPSPRWPGNSFDLLLDYLAAPDAARLGAQITARTVAAAQWNGNRVVEDSDWQGYLSPVGGRRGIVVVEGGGLELTVALPSGESAREWRSARVLLRLAESPESERFERTWLGFWRSFNLLQTLPNSGFSTGDFWSPVPAPETDQSGSGARWTPAWEELRSVCHSELEPLLRGLADAGIVAPEPGYEWMNDVGGVAGEAELAWPDSRVMVIDNVEAGPADWQRFDFSVTVNQLVTVLQSRQGH